MKSKCERRASGRDHGISRNSAATELSMLRFDYRPGGPATARAAILLHADVDLAQIEAAREVGYSGKRLDESSLLSDGYSPPSNPASNPEQSRPASQQESGELLEQIRSSPR